MLFMAVVFCSYRYTSVEAETLLPANTSHTVGDIASQQLVEASLQYDVEPGFHF